MNDAVSFRPRLALLIDAENVGPRHLGPILERVAERGLVTVRRIFADWSDPARSCWREPILQHALVAIQQFRLTPAKNGTDCALIIEAMDLAHSGRVDGVCLVTGDSDFTRLACRLRESGLLVYGFGQRNASAAFALACDQFTHVDDLLPAESPAAPPVIPIDHAPAAAIGTAPTPKAARPSPSKPAATAATQDARPRPAEKPTAVPSPLLQLIRTAYQNTKGSGGWAMLPAFSTELHRVSPGFQVKQHGATQLSKLLAKIPECEIRMIPTGKNLTPAPHSIRVK